MTGWPSRLGSCLLLLILTAPARGQDVEVVTLNLWHSRTQLADRTEAAARILEAVQPDVVGLQEASASVWRPSRAAFLARRLGHHYDYRMSNGTPAVFGEGLACTSREPLLARGRRLLSHSKRWPLERRFVQWVELALANGQRLLVFNTHLTHHAGHDVERLEQVLDVLEAVADLALERDVPAVLVGDLNAQERSLALRALTADLLGGAPPFLDAWRVAGSGDGITHAKTNPHADPAGPFARIDYVLCLRGTSRSLLPVRAVRIADRPVVVRPGVQVVASDHYGVHATLRWTTSVTARPATTATITSSQPAAQRRAADLRARVAAVRGWIAKARAEARAVLAPIREPDGSQQPVDEAQVRQLVLVRARARYR